MNSKRYPNYSVWGDKVDKRIDLKENTKRVKGV